MKSKKILVTLLAFALALACASMSWADAAFTSSNYTKGSFGIATSDGTSVTIKKGAEDTKNDPLIFTFQNSRGENFAAIAKRGATTPDTWTIYNITEGKVDLENSVCEPITTLGVNVHGFASDGENLYTATYQRIDSNAETAKLGELYKLSLSDYKVVGAPYKPSKKTVETVDYFYAGEAVAVIGDYVYVLWNVSNKEWSDGKYQPSELMKFKKDDLTAPIKTVAVGKNTDGQSSMTVHDGKLYIASLGGPQGASGSGGTYLSQIGEVHEVDPEAMTATKIFDGSKTKLTVVDDQLPDDYVYPYHTESMGVFSVTIAPGGDVYLHCAGVVEKEYAADEIDDFDPSDYTTDPDDDVDYDLAGSMVAGTYRTTLATLKSAADKAIPLKDPIHKWFNNSYFGIGDTQYDAVSNVLWIMAANELIACKTDGTIIKALGASDLGYPMYSLAVIPALPAPPVGPAIETPEAPASDTSEYKTDVKEAAAGDVNAIDESSRAEVIAAITGNTSAKIAEASFDITSDGATMKTADVRAIVSVDSSLVLPTEILDEVRPLPMFKAAVESGKIVVVGIEVSGSDLLATKSADVRLAKLRADGSAAMLTLVTKKSELEDGSFTLYDKANGKYADTIAATGSYVINIAIRDGGANDLDGKADGTVFDPIAAFSVTTKEPETRQSSGGACSTGAGIAVALAALAIIRRRTK